MSASAIYQNELENIGISDIIKHPMLCILILKSNVYVIMSLCCFLSSPSPSSSKLDNSRGVTSGGNGPHVHVDFCQYAGHMSSYVDYRVCPAVASPEGKTDICQRFSVSFKPFLFYDLFTKRNLSVLLKLKVLEIRFQY